MIFSASLSRGKKHYNPPWTAWTWVHIQRLVFGHPLHNFHLGLKSLMRFTFTFRESSADTTLSTTSATMPDLSCGYTRTKPIHLISYQCRYNDVGRHYQSLNVDVMVNIDRLGSKCEALTRWGLRNMSGENITYGNWISQSSRTPHRHVAT